MPLLISADYGHRRVALGGDLPIAMNNPSPLPLCALLIKKGQPTPDPYPSHEPLGCVRV